MYLLWGAELFGEMQVARLAKEPGSGRGVADELTLRRGENIADGGGWGGRESFGGCFSGSRLELSGHELRRTTRELRQNCGRDRGSKDWYNRSGIEFLRRWLAEGDLMRGLLDGSG